MTTSEFVEIACFAGAAEAEQIRGILQENDVAAFVDGANANITLSHVAVGLGGVKVCVRASDADRATEILDSLGDDSDVPTQAWFCGQCKEEIDGRFQVCWSCGEPREDVEQPFPAGVPNQRVAAGRQQNRPADVKPFDDSHYDQSNPYAPPRTKADDGRPGEQDAPVNLEVEAMFLRARRAAILGFVFLPIIIQFYSMYLLARATTLATSVSPVGQKRFYQALIMNLIGGCLWILILRSIYG